MASIDSLSLPPDLVEQVTTNAARLWGVVAAKHTGWTKSREHLAAALSVSVPTVQRCITELVRAGWLERTNRQAAQRPSLLRALRVPGRVTKYRGTGGAPGHDHPRADAVLRLHERLGGRLDGPDDRSKAAILARDCPPFRWALVVAHGFASRRTPPNLGWLVSNRRRLLAETEHRLWLVVEHERPEDAHLWQRVVRDLRVGSPGSGSWRNSGTEDGKSFSFRECVVREDEYTTPGEVAALVEALVARGRAQGAKGRIRIPAVREAGATTLVNELTEASL